MENKKISVVLPVYNGEHRVSRALESILHQTYQNFEVIAVNDCSTDDTNAVLQQFAQMDNRVRVIQNETNLKLPRTLNHGFEEAIGEYLTWTSDDNAYKPEALTMMAKYLDEHEEVDLVYCDFDIVQLDGTYKSTVLLLNPDEMRFENTVGACFLYRRELAKKIGEYDPELFLSEDYEYWLRAYLNGKMHHISEVLYEYGWHDKSLTVTRELQVRHKTYDAKNKHFEELISRCKTQDDKNRFYLTMLKHLVDDNERNRVRKQYYKLDKEFKKIDKDSSREERARLSKFGWFIKTFNL